MHCGSKNATMRLSFSIQILKAMWNTVSCYVRHKETDRKDQVFVSSAFLWVKPTLWNPIDTSACKFSNWINVFWINSFLILIQARLFVNFVPRHNPWNLPVVMFDSWMTKMSTTWWSWRMRTSRSSNSWFRTTPIMTRLGLALSENRSAPRNDNNASYIFLFPFRTKV